MDTSSAISPDRTLVIAPEPPWPTINGIRTKLAGFIHQLGPTVDVLSPPGDSTHVPSSGATWTTFVTDERKLSALRALATGDLPVAGRLSAQIVLPSLTRLLDSGVHYSVIHLDTFATAHLAVPLRNLMSQRGQHPVIVASINDSYSLLLSSGGLNNRLRLRIYCQYVKRAERRLLPTADWVDVVSENDLGWLRALVPAARPRLIPLGVDARAYSGPRLPAQWDILYLGTLSPPAFHWLRMAFDAVLPLVRAHLPQPRIATAGPDATAEALDYLSRNGVQHLGFVEDLSQLLRSTKTLIVSSRQRSGTPTKALQAMAAATPVLGMEALDGVPQGRNNITFSRADSWDDLAERIVATLLNEEEASRLGNAGRELVTCQHEWSVVCDRYFDFLGPVNRGTHADR